jgi:hypothetical protein
VGDPERSFDPLYLGDLIWSFATGFSLGPTVAELHAPNHSRILLHYAPLIAPVLLFFVALALYGGVQPARQNRKAFLVFALWFLFPLCLAVLGSLAAAHSFNVRYAILSLPAFIAVLAVGASRLRSSAVRTVACVLFVLVSAVSVFNYYIDERYYRDDNEPRDDFSPLTRRSAISSSPTPRIWLFLSRTYHSDPSGHIVTYWTSVFDANSPSMGSGYGWFCTSARRPDTTRAGRRRDRKSLEWRGPVAVGHAETSRRRQARRRFPQPRGVIWAVVPR